MEHRGSHTRPTKNYAWHMRRKRDYLARAKANRVMSYVLFFVSITLLLFLAGIIIFATLIAAFEIVGIL